MDSTGVGEKAQKNKLNILAQWIVVITAVCLAVLAFAWVAFHPMYDPDLWWHLKTGEWVVAHGALPSSDPFAFTSAALPTTREQAILQGYPASQIVYFLVVNSFGLTGLLVLRVLLLLALSGILIYAAHKRGAHVWAIAVCMVMGWGTFFWAHTVDRPHLFSFLFFAILISQLRPAGREHWWMMPIMAIWANFHGGYVVGCMVLVVYLCGRFFDVGWSREFKRSLYWSVGCIFASIMNPNGAYFLKEMLSGHLGGTASEGILEYASTFKVYAEGKFWVVLLWGQVLLAVFARILSRRFVWAEWLPMIILAALSLLYIRMVAFFSVCLIPFFAADLVLWLSQCKRPLRQLALICLVALMAIPVYANGRDVSRGWSVFWPEQNPLYPVDAASFLKSENLQGRMFNYYVWGGYLIWKLYPQYQVFIDGRAFDDRLFADSQAIERGDFAPPERQYERLLNQYQVDFVVIPIQYDNGSLFGLFTRLYNNPRWEAVYADMRTAIFVRKSGSNQASLATHGMTKQTLFNATLSRFRLRVVGNRGDLSAWQGAVELYIINRRMQEAREVLSQALQVAPGDPGLNNLVPVVGLGRGH